MAACGWKDAAKLEQQDTSEAFSFLTETLELPLLTLKMDIYHDGAEDATDDHKLIHERLLEVAVPEEPGNGKHIQLEDCLESYFNNRISVTRKLERSNTKSSVRSRRSSSVDKGGSQHIEVSDISWSNPGTPTSTHAPRTPLTPSGGRSRTDSIIRHRVIEEIQEEAKANSPVDSDAMTTGTVKRKSSIRKEVMMPAWQFFNLIRPSPIYSHNPQCLICYPFYSLVLIGETAWYTNPPKPVNDAVVATHFSKKRPVLGICLKRYGMSADGKAFRKNTFIDIPVDVRLPHFVDEDMNDQIGEPLMGNFKLSLVAVICHRGSSVNAGHYISFIRGITQIADGDSASSRRMSSSSRPPEYPVDQWIKHDDLSEPERVTKIDNIEEALKDEMPYLLFYQVLPTYEMTPASGDLDHQPPLYEHETGIDVRIEESSPISERKPTDEQPQSYFDGIRERSIPAPSIRFSAELERPRHSINVPERRASVAVTESSLASAASSVRMSEPALVPSVPPIPPIPATPPEETTAQRLSRAASRFKSSSKSRPTSSSGENRESRFSATFSRMAQRSKEQLNKTEGSKISIPISTHDGASETRDSAIVIDDTALKPGEESPPKRSKSTRGRKRDKSKDPAALKADEVENEVHHHHGHRVKVSRDMPDRQCKIM